MITFHCCAELRTTRISVQGFDNMAFTPLCSWIYLVIWYLRMAFIQIYLGILRTAVSLNVHGRLVVTKHCQCITTQPQVVHNRKNRAIYHVEQCSHTESVLSMDGRPLNMYCWAYVPSRSCKRASLSRISPCLMATKYCRSPTTSSGRNVCAHRFVIWLFLKPLKGGMIWVRCTSKSCNTGLLILH